MRKCPPLDELRCRVAVVMPIKNEAHNIRDALQTLRAQSFPSQRMEVLVVDGGSQDGTREIVGGLANAWPGRLKVLNNLTGSIPTAMNIGLAATAAEVVVRLDGHTRLAPDYVERCVGLLARTGAANVGGLMRPRGAGLVGSAMALALSSRFGVGDSRFHDLSTVEPEYAETVYLGAFRHEVLDEVGGYDEAQLANEDFELNYRIREAGYGVLLSPDLHSIYEPRDTVVKIGRQFFRYGLWKSRVMRTHPRSVRVRHLAAPLLTGTLAMTLVAWRLTRRGWLMMPLAVYAVATLLAAVSVARPRRLALPLVAVFPAMHISWGAGVIVGFLKDSALHRRKSD